MKKVFLIILAFLLLYNNLLAQNPYYWAEGNKYYFEDNDSKFYISYSDESLRKFLSQVDLQKDIFSQGISQNPLKVQPFYWAYITPTLMSQIKDYPISYFSHNYKIKVKKNGEIVKYDEFGISDIFYVQLKNHKDTVLLQDYSERFGIQILGGMPVFTSLVRVV